MNAFKQSELPMEEFQSLGLHNGQDWLINQKTKQALLSGQLTPFVQLRNIKIDGAEGMNLDAKLSLRRTDSGEIRLAIHPIYKEETNHPLLSREDVMYMKLDGVYARKEAVSGRISQQASAPYRFIPGNPPSPYVELEKPDGGKERIWGSDVSRAVVDSGFKLGDSVQIKLAGVKQQTSDTPSLSGQSRLLWTVQAQSREKTEDRQALYEYDPQTKSTVRTDDRQFLLPDHINGVDLSPREKERLRRGEDVDLKDGSRVQLSPASEGNFRANRSLLLASFLIDGGLSYAIYKGVKTLVENGKTLEQKDPDYSAGYVDALKKVQQDLEQKQARFPKDGQIARDLGLVRQEALRVSEIPAADYGQIKARVNDPELENNAQDREVEQERKRSDGFESRFNQASDAGGASDRGPDDPEETSRIKR